VIKGLPTVKGCAWGRALIRRDADLSADAAEYAGPEEEKRRFLDAVEASRAQIETLSEKLKHAGDQNGADIIESQLAYLDDPDIIDATKERIETGGLRAQQAVLAVTGAMAEEFGAFDDPYISERAADIRDVGERVAAFLSEALA